MVCHMVPKLQKVHVHDAKGPSQTAVIPYPDPRPPIASTMGLKTQRAARQLFLAEI